MIVMNLDPIKGDCKIDGYADWITLDDCSVEIAREPKESGHTGTTDLLLGMPDCGPVSLKKTCDKASIYLQKMAIGGGALGKDSKCQIVWLESGIGHGDEQKFNKYMELELTRPILKKYAVDASGNDRAVEAIELIYSKILMTYYERNPNDGSQIKHGPQGWDLVSGKPCNS